MTGELYSGNMQGSSEEGDAGRSDNDVEEEYGDASREETKQMDSYFNNNHPLLRFRSDLLEEFSIPPEIYIRSLGGVWSKATIPKGMRWPFFGKWLGRPIDVKYSWEIHFSGNRGYLDGSLNFNNWLKFIRSSNQAEKHNIRSFLLGGQVYYETTCTIYSGQELIMAPKVPLNMDSIFTEGRGPISEDRSDKDSSVSQHSGTVEEDREDELGEEEEIRCLVCAAVYQNIYQLEEHLITGHHYPPDQYRCESCSQTFCWRPHLNYHQAQVHGRKFPCENCTKVFSDPSNLQRHIRTHHVGARQHACQECGKTFATSSGLKQHTHIHSSVKPFRCEVCHKAYTQFSNLCRHKRMHANCRMQIKCVKCDQSFSTVTSLSKHKRFCDSTVPGSTPPGQSALSAMAHQNPGLINPYLIYPRPGGPLPFYPPSLMPPYSGLFPNQPGTPSHPLLSNPLLFNQSLKSYEDLDRTKVNINLSVEAYYRFQLQNNVQLTDEKRKPSLSPRKSDTHKANGKTFDFVDNREAPLPREEAHTDQNLSPGRPIVNASNATTYPNPREQLEVVKFEIKSETTNTKKRDKPTNFSIDKLSGKLDSPNNDVEEEKHKPKKTKYNDQPLDLSTVSKSCCDSEKQEANESLVKAPASPPLEIGNDDSLLEKSLLSPESEHQPQVEVESRSPSPIKTSSPSTPISKPNTTPMAYPKPIHPMSLESFFPLKNFTSRSYPSYPPPHPSDSHGPTSLSGFNPQRSFPFLGIMNGVNNNLGVSRNPYEHLLRSQMSPYVTKPFQEILSSQTNAIDRGSGGKVTKDRYSCKYCGKVFPRSANLTRHLRTHTGEQPYKCKYCERSFSISSNLQRHVRNIHNKEKPFKCPLCDRCFGQQTNLDRHLKKHEADDGSGLVSIADSPESSNENEREDAYFDEIRSFMGKVTYSGDIGYNQENLFTAHNPPLPPIDVKEDDENESEFLSDEDETEDTFTPDFRKSPLELDNDSPISYSLKTKGKSEMINNNNTPSATDAISLHA